MWVLEILSPESTKLVKKVIPKRKESESPKQNTLPKVELKMTTDGLRGLKLLTTGIGDKESDKNSLERELKRRLFNPNEFAHFLKNLANYLESI